MFPPVTVTPVASAIMLPPIAVALIVIFELDTRYSLMVEAAAPAVSVFCVGSAAPTVTSAGMV